MRQAKDHYAALWADKFCGPYQSPNDDGLTYHCGPCDSNISWKELEAQHSHKGYLEYCNCDDTEHLHCPGCDHIVVRTRQCDEGYEEEEEEDSLCE
jgi:hypothetical protein